MMGDDAARLCTAQRRAVPCRAIARPIQNNNKLYRIIVQAKLEF